MGHHRIMVATDSNSVYNGSSLIHGSMPWRSQVFMRNGENGEMFQVPLEMPCVILGSAGRRGLQGREGRAGSLR